jgi:L-xylulokinase
MERYFLGLDNGGTIIKAALFDEKGKEIAVASRQTKLLTPKPGYTERDMGELWEQNAACIRQALSDAGIGGDKVAGVAVCGHGKGLYPWGKDGKPAYNGIISTDNRAWQYVETWKKDGTHAGQYPKLCQQIMACQQVPLLAWMKEHEKAVYDNIRWAFSVKDYVRFRLTGEAFCEATDISGSGLLNLRDVKFDRDMLAAFGIPEAFDMTAPLKYSYENCGAVTAEAASKTGLAQGTPVAGGFFDIDACAIAMAVTKPEQLCTITGTWSINEFIAEKPALNTAIAMNSLYAIPGYYLIEESSATSAGNLDWVQKNVFPELNFKQLDELTASCPSESADIYFLPFLYGSNGHPLAKASFVGLTNFHSKAHMLRAVYEGIVFSAKGHIDKLLSVRARPAAIRLAGGAANSPFWVQMYADILEIPIETVTGVKELGALGCAMAASVAAGVYKDYNEAAAAMVRIAPPVAPDPSKAGIYRKKYEKYRAVCEALNAVWDRFEV